MTLLTANAIQNAMVREAQLEDNLADEPLGPQQPQTDDELRAHFDAAVGGTVEEAGAEGEIVAIFDARQPSVLDKSEDYQIVHIQWEDGVHQVLEDVLFVEHHVL